MFVNNFIFEGSVYYKVLYRMFHLAGFQGKEKRVTEKVLLTAFEVFKEPGARVVQTPR
jgi:hypothetical protein